MKSSIYIGWKHVYFLMPGMVLMALYGISEVIKQGKAKWVRMSAAAVCAFLLLGQAGYIVRYHPMQCIYFNPVGVRWAQYFDRDYWNLSIYGMLQDVMREDPSERITVGYLGVVNATILYRLTPEEQARVAYLTEQDAEKPMYVFDTLRNVVGNEVYHEGYEEYKSYWQGNFKFAQISKRVDP